MIILGTGGKHLWRGSKQGNTLVKKFPPIGSFVLRDWTDEENYSRYLRELERKGEFIPVPTAVSHYHLLDEAFHK
jgi:hypothetical protein